MFSNYIGFEKVDLFLKKYYEKWTHPDKAIKKVIQALIVVALTVFVWNMPSSWFGMEGITVVQ